jgi:hypothetical protein
MADGGREERIRLQGRRLLRPATRLLRRLHKVKTARDRARNRQLFFDQYAMLLLLYFFTPTLKSLRALQKATNWEQTRRKLGIRRTSLGSLSEASTIFDARLLRQIVQELAGQACPLVRGREAEALRGLTAVDGSVFSGLSRMAWALWQDAEHRGVKLHLHFDVLSGVPSDAVLTPAACSEPKQLAASVKPHCLYVMDGGYFQYELLGRILQADSSFVARVTNQMAFDVQEERPLDELGCQAGVVRDVILSRVGFGPRQKFIQRPVRLVVVKTADRVGNPVELWLLTDRLDLSADLIALAYKYRWTVELFFRWLKSVLGTRHLIAHSANGVALQMYAALIVSLLIVLYTHRKPNRRTFEAIQFYLLGWVSEEELDRELASLPEIHD